MTKVWKSLNDYFKSDTRVFARGMSKEKLFFVFLIGSIIGCLYEELLNMLVIYIQSGDIIWETRRGLIYFELSPIYGFGAVLMVKILMKHKRTWYENYGYGAIIGGIFEYLASYLQERFAGTVSWDYTGYFLNINGRTTIPFMLFWGLGALLLVYYIYPYVSNKIEKIHYKLGRLIYKILVVIVALDMFISFGAAIRQGVRRYNYGPYTYLDRYFDKYYPDEKLTRIYKTAIFK